MRSWLGILAVILLVGCEGRIEPHTPLGLDLGTDAGPGLDRGFRDAEAPELDATADAMVDANEDAEVDAGFDAEVDGGEDAMVDGATDAEIDGGPDAEIDAGEDLGVDVGMDAEPMDADPMDADPVDMGPIDAGTPDAGDTPPVVQILGSPPTLIGAAGITLTVDATDDVGVVTVFMRVDGAPVDSDATPPYELTWIPNGIGDGARQLIIGALDTASQVGNTSHTVTVDETPPTVAVDGPSSGAALDSRSYTAEATANDANGVAMVIFTVDGVPTATVTTAPYAAAITVAQSGDHELAALAIDSVDNRRTSAAVTLTIDLSPQVVFVSPASQASVGGTVTLEADATDDLGVQQVEFAVGTVSLGVDDTAPYTADWATVGYALGTHMLSATVTDTNGRTASATIAVTVTDASPTVAITAPASGDTVARTVRITADASDDSGVAMVDVAADGATLLSMPTPPFEADWDTCARSDGAGLVAVTARDGRGQTTTATLGVTVDNASVPPSLSGYGAVDAVVLEWTTCAAGSIYDVYWAAAPGVTVTSSVVNLAFIDTYTQTTTTTRYYRVAEVIGGVVGPLSNEVSASPLGTYGAAFIGRDRVLFYDVSPTGESFDHFVSVTGSNDTPSWSPTGNEIAFNYTQQVGYSTNPRVRLYDVENRTTVFNLNGGEASWAADGSRVITVDDAQQCFRTYDVSTSMQQCLSESGRRDAPEWDPVNAGRFAFIGDAIIAGPPTLFVRDTGATRISVASSVRAFAWRPDGAGLAYVQNAAAGLCAIKVGTIDASSLLSTTDVADGVSCTSQVSWSPNNDEVAFWSTSPGGRGVFVLSMSTSSLPAAPANLTPLAETSGVIEAIDWTPDGALLGFTTTSGINFTLNLCPVRGGPTTTPLTTGGTGDFEFSPVNP